MNLTQTNNPIRAMNEPCDVCYNDIGSSYYHEKLTCQKCYKAFKQGEKEKIQKNIWGRIKGKVVING